MACTACQKAKELAKGLISSINANSANYYIGILQSYGVSANPTEEQIELAKARSEVCKGCEHIRYFGETSVKGEIIRFIEDNFASETLKQIETNYASCSACGCPLFAKVLADTSNENLDCPLGKWINDLNLPSNS